MHNSHRTIGKAVCNLDMFEKDIKYIISEDIERFRRNSFKLTDADNNCIFIKYLLIKSVFFFKV